MFVRSEDLIDDPMHPLFADPEYRRWGRSSISIAEAQRRSKATLRRNATDRAAARAKEREQVMHWRKLPPKEKIDRFLHETAVRRGELGDLAFAVVVKIGLEILGNEITIDRASDARAVVQAFYEITRLEAGQPTVSIERLTPEQREAKILSLVEKAKATTA